MKNCLLSFYRYGERTLSLSRTERSEEGTRRSLFTGQTTRGAEEEDGAAAEIRKAAKVTATGNPYGRGGEEGDRSGGEGGGERAGVGLPPRQRAGAPQVFGVRPKGCRRDG